MEPGISWNSFAKSNEQIDGIQSMGMLFKSDLFGCRIETTMTTRHGQESTPEPEVHAKQKELMGAFIKDLRIAIFNSVSKYIEKKQKNKKKGVWTPAPFNLTIWKMYLRDVMHKVPHLKDRVSEMRDVLGTQSKLGVAEMTSIVIKALDMVYTQHFLLRDDILTHYESIDNVWDSMSATTCGDAATKRYVST
jgi:hypothetical protein